MDALKPKLIYIVTEDWYFCSHRLPLAMAARDAGFEVVVVTRVDGDQERILSQGFRLIPLDMRRGELNPLNEIRTLFRLIGILRRERPALLHNVALKPVILGTLSARLTSVPRVVNALAGLGYVYTSRDAKAALMKPLSNLLFRILFKNPASRVVVQNSVDRELLLGAGVPEGRVTIIEGSGVDAEEFAATPEPDGPVVAAMVSRMLWDKGVGDLVEAARIMARRRADVRVRLVGPPDPANPSSIDESTLAEWSEQALVEWLGPVRDIARIWGDAHIGVLPSYREGLPKSLLEAAACGRPLVATDVPGCRDVVIHDVTGLLVPPGDPHALAEAIIRLSKDRALRARMGAAARARVLERFSVDRVVGETLELYRSVGMPAPPG